MLANVSETINHETMKELPPIICKKSVKHTFNPEEKAQLAQDLLQALSDLKTAESDFDSIKASFKAKISEAEAKIQTVSSTMRAGFEMRVKECTVKMRPNDKKKDFYVDGMIVLTEDMTSDDFQEDLLRAESLFSKKVELVLWDAGEDHGRLIVGEQGGRWFTALRCNIGAAKLEDRLDSEQPSSKKRFDAITRAGKRAVEWVTEVMGKEASKGICELIAPVIDKEREKVE